MRGKPKHLNAKQDYINYVKLWPEEGKQKLQSLLDGRVRWMNTGKIEEGDGVTDETHKVSVLKDEEGNITEKYQREWKENPGAKIFRLGFTVDEVNAMI